MRSDRAVPVLQRYPAFSYLRVVPAYLREKPLVANNLLLLFFATTLALGSWRDSTLILPGVDIGLLEHPTLLSFLLLQAVLFRAAIDSIESLGEGHVATRLPFTEGFIKGEQFDNLKTEAERYISRTTNLSRLLFVFFSAMGLICLIWNSYQNQFGQLYLGFDFWDSAAHPFGYWTSRVYKLYLWVFFIPSIAHFMAGIFIILARTVTKADDARAIEIAPFHQDGIGGMSSLVTPVTKPLRSVFVVCSLAAVSALAVHREPDLTPLIGITFLALCLLSLFWLYLIPLGRAITDAKGIRLSAISIQQERILAVIDSPRATTAIANSISAIQGLEEVKKVVTKLPSYPHLRAVSRFIGILLGSQYLLAAARVVIAIVTERLLE